MNYLIASVKKIRPYQILIADEIIFESIEMTNSREYDSDYKLDIDEWFVVRDFSQKPYCLPLLTQPFVSTSCDQINQNQLQNIKFICSIQEDGIYFQKITSQNIIKRRYLRMSNEPRISNEPILSINDYPDAFYNRESDSLFFRRLTAISSIFRGIDQLYREATHEETNDFLQSDFLTLDNGYDSSKVKKANRRRIALITDTFRAYSITERQAVLDYIQGYCEDVPYENGVFTISTEEDLKNLLYGIDQRFYTTNLGQEKRLASSIVKLNS